MCLTTYIAKQHRHASWRCDLEADLIIKTCDGHLFATHHQIWRASCGNLPKEIDERLAVVTITESAEVWTLLSQFMHNQPQPSLDDLSFKSLVAFADAAHKYSLYGAIPISVLRIQYVSDLVCIRRHALTP